MDLNDHLGKWSATPEYLTTDDRWLVNDTHCGRLHLHLELAHDQMLAPNPRGVPAVSQIPMFRFAGHDASRLGAAIDDARFSDSHIIEMTSPNTWPL
jgi:hypothetical protein